MHVPPDVRALADELLSMFYDDLKRLARRERRRVGGGDTLQTTALVNEAYLKLRGSRGWNDDAHFLRAAALAMRHALVNHAAHASTHKRGSGAVHLPLDDALDVGAEDDAVVLLSTTAWPAPRGPRRACRSGRVPLLRRLRRHRHGAALGLSERTVRRDWTLARAWFHRELGGAESCRHPYQPPASAAIAARNAVSAATIAALDGSSWRRFSSSAFLPTGARPRHRRGQ